MGVFTNDVGRPSNKTIIIRNILKVIGFLIIIIGVFAAGYYLKGNENTKKVDNNVKEESNKKVDVDKLYGYFKDIPISPYFEDFYTENGILSNSLSDLYMLSIAANNLEANQCKGKYDEYVTRCFEKEKILSKTEEIFGKNLNVQNGEEIYPGFASYTYSSKNSEFYHSGDGATDGEYIKNMYDYKIENNKVYIYEVVAVAITGFDNDIYLDLSGNEISLPKGTDNENIIEYKDKLEKFKWTFVKDNNDNYIFDNVKKIK